MSDDVRATMDAIRAVERDTALLDLIARLNRLDDQRAEQIAALHTELAEIRDGMVALANRIEGVASLRAYPPPVIVPRPS